MENCKVFYKFRDGRCLVVPSKDYLVNGKSLELCNEADVKLDFNPYHDKRGRFTTKGGATNEVFVRPKEVFAWEMERLEGESFAQVIERAKVLEAERNAYMDKWYKASEDRIRKYIGKNTMYMNLRDELDPDVVKSLADNIEAFAEKFPQIKGAIDFVRCDTMEPNVVAGFHMTGKHGNGIVLNTEKFKNSKVLRSAHEKDRAANFHPKNTDEYQYFQHELAHALEEKANRVLFNKGLDKARRENFNVENKMRDVNLSQELFDKAIKEYGSETIRQEVSVYATADSHEFLAECISEYTNSPNPRPIASRVSMDFAELVVEKLKSIEE